MSHWVREQSYRFETLARSRRQQAFAALRALPDLGSVRRMNAPGILAEKAAFESPSAPPQLAKDVRGAIMVEYVVVLLLVSGVSCAAIVVLGMAMARFYMAQEAWLAIPFP
jgi:Flp pilus assembly pilin Flp